MEYTEIWIQAANDSLQQKHFKSLHQTDAVNSGPDHYRPHLQ